MDCLALTSALFPTVEYTYADPLGHFRNPLPFFVCANHEAEFLIHRLTLSSEWQFPWPCFHSMGTSSPNRLQIVGQLTAICEQYTIYPSHFGRNATSVLIRISQDEASIGISIRQNNILPFSIHSLLISLGCDSDYINDLGYLLCFAGGNLPRYKWTAFCEKLRVVTIQQFYHRRGNFKVDVGREHPSKINIPKNLINIAQNSSASVLVSGGLFVQWTVALSSVPSHEWIVPCWNFLWKPVC